MAVRVVKQGSYRNEKERAFSEPPITQYKFRNLWKILLKTTMDELSNCKENVWVILVSQHHIGALLRHKLIRILRN